MEDRVIRPSMKTVYAAYAVAVLVIIAGFWAYFTYADNEPRWLLALSEGATALPQHLGSGRHSLVTFLSGPEGGLSPAEEIAAVARGFAPVTLGPRVLRAETAALTALARLLG